jgi:hypothetical protein
MNLTGKLQQQKFRPTQPGGRATFFSFTFFSFIYFFSFISFIYLLLLLLFLSFFLFFFLFFFLLNSINSIHSIHFNFEAAFLKDARELVKESRHARTKSNAGWRKNKLPEKKET